MSQCRISLALLAACPGLALASEPSHRSTPDLKRLEAKIEKIRSQFVVPGLSVAIVQDDKVLYAHGFGLRNVQSKLPVTTNTVFCIGSASKAFTCLLTTEAAEEGLLKLSDSPTKYIPTFIPRAKEQRERLTITDIMSHRSGYPRTDAAWWAGDFSSEELVQILSGAVPTNKIGATFLYQNLMLMLTGLIDQKVFGKPYADLVSEKIFQPLGMAHTSARTMFLAEQSDHSTGYGAAPFSPSQPLDLHPIDQVAPAGSIVSTATDMAQWIRLQLNEGALNGKQLFAKKAVLEQRIPRITVIGEQSYGFGWFLSKWGKSTLVDHGGNIDGFSAEVALLPEKHLGVVVLTNQNGSSAPTAVRDAVLEELVGPGTTALVSAAGPDAKKFKDADPALAGTYELKTPPVSIRIDSKGGKWTLSQGPITLDMKTVDDGVYALTNPAAPKIRVSFVPNLTNPKLTDMLLEQSGNKIHFVKQSPYKAPITIETLVSKVVEAEGGRVAYQKLGNLTEHLEAEMPADGMHVVSIRYVRSGHDTAEFSHAYALGRMFSRIWSIATPNLEAALIGHGRTYPARISPGGAVTASLDHLAWLHPKVAFAKLEISGEEKVAGENAYVVEGLSKAGREVDKFWFSTKTFLWLKASFDSSGGSVVLGDYRNVDGVKVPFRETIYSADGSPTFVTVQSVDFASRIPDWPFKFPKDGRLN